MDSSVLVTTNMTMLNDTTHMPGYAGYRPKNKYSYGETFGKATAKYFQARRKEELETSVVKDKGVDSDGRVRFPSLYSNEPALVLGARKRNRERWLAQPRYALFNRHQRDSEIEEFDQKAQNHREFYTDKSGTVNRMEYFVISKKQNSLKSTKQKDFEDKQSDGSIDDHSLSKDAHLKPLLFGHKAPLDVKEYMRKHHPLPKRRILPRSTWRDRHLRDVYFERR